MLCQSTARHKVKYNIVKAMFMRATELYFSDPLIVSIRQQITEMTCNF
jgi:hypothetical protein